MVSIYSQLEVANSMNYGDIFIFTNWLWIMSIWVKLQYIIWRVRSRERPGVYKRRRSSSAERRLIERSHGTQPHRHVVVEVELYGLVGLCRWRRARLYEVLRPRRFLATSAAAKRRAMPARTHIAKGCQSGSNHLRKYNNGYWHVYLVWTLQNLRSHRQCL